MRSNTQVVLVGLFVALIAIVGTQLYIHFFSDSKQTMVDASDFVEIARATTTTDFLALTLNYPKDPRDVNQLIEKEIEQFKAVAKKDSDEYGASTEQPQVDKHLPLDFSVDYNTTRSQKLGTRCHTLNFYSYTGGAHGSTVASIYCFSSDKKHLSFSDVFKPTKETYTFLSKSVIGKVKEQIKDFSENDSFKEGYAPEQKNFETFIISDEGVKFIFQQYQIAPYALGMPEISFRWSELSSIKQDSFDLPLD